MTQRIRLHIDRVVVPRHLAGDPAAIEAAIRAEVTRQIGGATALPMQSRRVDVADGGTLGGSGPLGTRIGAAVAKGVLG